MRDARHDGRPTDWAVAELDRHSMKRELQRLKLRARSHPIRLLLLAALLTAGALYYKQRKDPPHRAYVVMRVTEGAIVEEHNPLVGKSLDEYLRSVTLSNKQISDIVEKHDLYPMRQTRGEMFAVQAFRSNMKVSSANNYFATARQYDQAARTARITLRFQDRDPALAFAVAQDLAAAVAANEQRRREAASSKLSAVAAGTLERSEKRALALKEQISRKRLEIDSAAAKRLDAEARSTLEVELSRLESMYEQALHIMSRSEGQLRSVNLLLAADAADLGLRFQVVDIRRPIPRRKVTAAEIGLWATGLFILVLPLAGIGVGAFDSRLHTTDDVGRLGLPVVGHVPPFRGHRTGSLSDRRRRMRL